MMWSRSAPMIQFQADLLGASVVRPKNIETTATGAAYLAGLRAGNSAPPEAFGRGWALERRFTPHMAPALRAQKYARWQRAVEATMAAAG